MKGEATHDNQWNSSDADVSMDNDDANHSETLPSSPPKPPRVRTRLHGVSSTASRLFSDDDDDDMNRDSTSSMVLRPLDLNLELNDEAAVTSSAASTKSKQQQHSHQRKRHAEQRLQGRDLSFEDDTESPIHMYTSPRISPSCYKSPASYMTLSYKSPSSFRTMDGRMVQSKNPFSPMLMEDTPAKARQIAESLTFPVSFEDDSKKKESNADADAIPNVAPLLRHRLHKRDSLLDSPTARSVSYHYNSFTRDGYPNRTGLYSFTGSPIKEMDIAGTYSQNASIPTSCNKVRRLKKGEDVVAASHHDHATWKKQNLDIDTSSSKFYIHGDEISPTDVLSFPFAAPSTPSGVPPTPSKPRYYRRTQTRYTPLRRPVAPQTPMPDRRRTPARTRSFDHDSDDEEDSSTSKQQSQSRFHSDFDIIGELGKGSFGCVYKVLSRLDGCMYAVKTAHRAAKGNADKDRMLKEVYALAALSDQADTATFHIVRYHQAWMEENRLFIQTELCTCTLTDDLKQGNLVSEQRRYKFLREMLLALEFIHRHGMVHLDIKPDNIFVSFLQFGCEFASKSGLLTSLLYRSA